MEYNWKLYHFIDSNWWTVLFIEKGENKIDKKLKSLQKHKNDGKGVAE
jgi:hypothetical protein